MALRALQVAPDNSTASSSSPMFASGNLVRGSVAIRVRTERAVPCVVLHNIGPNITAVKLVKGNETIAGGC